MNLYGGFHPWTTEPFPKANKHNYLLLCRWGNSGEMRGSDLPGFTKQISSRGRHETLGPGFQICREFAHPAGVDGNSVALGVGQKTRILFHENLHGFGICFYSALSQSQVWGVGVAGSVLSGLPHSEQRLDCGLCIQHPRWAH